MAVTTAPATSSDRIGALDVIRGVAVLGILIMNIMAMGLPLEAVMHPTVAGGTDGADYWSWFIANTFVEGSMRTLFSALFGAGFILLLDRLEARGVGLQAADIHYRRLAFLAAFGMVDMYVFYWEGDILFLYAIVGAFLFPFRRLPAGWLIAAAAGLVAFGMLLQPSWPDSMEQSRASYQTLVERRAEIAETNTMPDEAVEQELAELETASQAWITDSEIARPSEEQIEADIAHHRSSYFSQLRTNFLTYTEAQRERLFVMLIPNPDALVAMLLGIALMRLGILSGKARASTYALMLAGGYGIGVPLSLWETMAYANSGFDILSFARSNLTYDIGRLSMACGHAGLILLLCKWGGAGVIGRGLSFALASVGRMALTNYLLHSICALFLFTGAGLALYGALSRSELLLVMLGIWALNIAFSIFWLNRYRFGPAEWLWRSLTYWEIQPLKRSAAPAS